MEDDSVLVEVCAGCGSVRTGRYPHACTRAADAVLDGAPEPKPMSLEETLKALGDLPLKDVASYVIRLRGERDAWKETAAQESRNRDYYRGLLMEIGANLGPEARTCDDGTVSLDPLAAKLPLLVAKLPLLVEDGARRVSICETLGGELSKASLALCEEVTKVVERGESLRPSLLVALQALMGAVAKWDLRVLPFPVKLDR